MNASVEHQVVKHVARMGPWLAPVPSAYFIGRSSTAHLALPLWVAFVSAIVIEILGVVSVYTFLLMYNYNLTRRKPDPPAPTWLALILCTVYLVTAIAMSVLLEIRPAIATYAIALFPVLSLVGAVNLVLVNMQEKRELDTRQEKEERKRERTRKVFRGEQVNSEQSSEQVNRRKRIVEMLQSNGHDVNLSQISREVGVGRTTLYKDLAVLKEEGVIRKGNGVYTVIGGKNG